MEYEEMSEKEKRIRAITQIYYSNPKVQEALVTFAKNREVVPRYFEGFGKRPDMIQYPSDILNLVKNGATSFHASEELWNDPLQLNLELSTKELAKLRKGWDLLIDIDSKYLDLSREASKLILELLENFDIKNYGVKFSVTEETSVLIKAEKNISLMPIKKAIDIIKTGKELSTLSINKEKKLVFSNIYDYLEHKDKIYEVLHEQSKIPLKVTGHHSIFVFERGEIVQKKVSEIKKGDYLITFNAKNNPVSEIKEGYEIENEFIFNSNPKKIKVSITKDLMRLLGYYLAEGHVTNIINQVGFSFNQNEKKYIEDVIYLLEKITKKNISIRHPNPGSTQILIHSKEWANFFEKICGKKKEKHVPEFSWKLSKNLFLEMLKGYIRGDGYKIGKYAIAIKSVALQLTRELVWLCNLNGISCSLSCEQNKPHKLPQGNSFVGSFMNILNIPKSELNNEEFNRKRNKFSPFPRDKTLPIDGLKECYNQIKPKMFNHHRAEQMTLKKERANSKRILRVIEWLKTNPGFKINKKSQKTIDNYLTIIESDVAVVKIKDVKKLHKTAMVYDVSVENTEAFFGNDYPILLHNSGSKGFHIIIPQKAFPQEFNGMKTKEMFPEWPRAIVSYLLSEIKPEFRRSVGKIMSFSSLKEHEELKIICNECGNVAQKGTLEKMKCSVCNLEMERKETPGTRKKIKCLNRGCGGIMEVVELVNYYYCEHCRDPKNEKFPLSSNKYKEMFKVIEGELADAKTDLDLVLVAPRHLFRMPYSLHEKTALASVVLNKNELVNFNPKDADPLKVRILDYSPNSVEGEAKRLLAAALDWKKGQDALKEIEEKRYNGIYKESDFKEIDFREISEDMFPPAIKKLLLGLNDGKKRGLFILITFLRSLNFPPEYINTKVREWNQKNDPPLREGYVKSQIDWHLKQKKKIMPPNYANDNFYKDLGLLEKKPETKNPLVDVKRNMKR